MSEQWGTTGRVTLRTDRDWWFTECYRVMVDDAPVNFIARDEAKGGRIWGESEGGRWFPTRDLAVMGALRSAAPDVWRAERPVVYRVTWDRELGDGAWKVWGPRGLFPITMARADSPMTSATAWARADLARDAR